MGYIAHHAIIITISDWALDNPHGMKAGPNRADIEAFRESLPEPYRNLLVGPFPSAINSYHTMIFLPDGSKEGWDTSDEGDKIRARVIEFFSWRYEDGSSPHDVIEIRYGGDEPDLAAITYNKDGVEP